MTDPNVSTRDDLDDDVAAVLRLKNKLGFTGFPVTASWHFGKVGFCDILNWLLHSLKCNILYIYI